MSNFNTRLSVIGPTDTSNTAPYVFTPPTNDWIGINIAYSACVASGGGKVQLLPVTYDLLTGNPSKQAIPISPKVRFIGSGYSVDGGGNPIGGTILSGDGTFPAFALNDTDKTGSQYTFAQIVDLLVSGVEISDMAFFNVSYGIKAGALGMPSVWYSSFKNLLAVNCTKWGFWFENYQYCNFNGIKSQQCLEGAQAYMMSCSEYNMGNSNHFDIYHAGNVSGINQRGIVIGSRTSPGLGLWGTQLSGSTASAVVNDSNFYGLQSNASSTGKITQVATMTNSSANIVVTDATKFPVAMPVSFDATTNGVRKYLTYFVKTCDIGTNTITLSDEMGRGNTITSSGSNSVNILTWGFPTIEHVAYDSGSALQYCSFYGVDAEGINTVRILNQRANAIWHLTTIGGTRGVDCASLFCARKCSNLDVSSTKPLSWDVDQFSAPYTHQIGGQIIDDDGNGAFAGFFAPSGVYFSRKRSSLGLALSTARGESQGGANGVPEVDLISTMAGNRPMLLPLIPMAQVTNYSSITNFTLDADRAGSIGYIGTSATTWTLPTLHDIPATANTNVGICFEISNESTSAVALTVSANTGQYFGRSGSKSSYSIPQGGSIVVRGAYDGTNFYWRIVSNNGAV